ncbi:MAG: TetR/AcrR family transcriptional regulator [Dysgonamonadaceae bacterium]|jgi:AcrR family transcriptional regulator|nr:TetR/AcrR family transcriptional regulator [Dysgonamonadaceae bacterium]
MNKNKQTTEEKILEAARKVFTHKGFSEARTRDIAQEAGINVALLNYYFRSKENLLRIVIEEKIHELFGKVLPILGNKDITLRDKIEKCMDYYCELLLENPDLPLFVLNEIKSNNNVLEISVQKLHPVAEPVIMAQLAAIGSKMSFPDFIMNVAGLTLLPFIACPLLNATGLVEKEKFTEYILNRKKQIPQWIMSTLKDTENENNPDSMGYRALHIKSRSTNVHN